MPWFARRGATGGKVPIANPKRPKACVLDWEIRQRRVFDLLFQHPQSGLLHANP